MNSTNTDNFQAHDRYQRISILIIDGGQVDNTLINTIERWGHDVSVAKYDNEALEKIAATNFDLILLALNTSNDKGVDFIRKIRESAGNVNIATITSHSDRDLEQRARQQRITCYLIKPFHFDELKSIVNHLSRRKNK